MVNSADPDQLAKPTDLDLHCLQRQDISGFSRTRINVQEMDCRYQRLDNFLSALTGGLLMHP